MQSTENTTYFKLFDRAAESTEEVSNLRPPRLIHDDGIIRPYDRCEAEGYNLFEVSFNEFFSSK